MRLGETPPGPLPPSVPHRVLSALSQTAGSRLPEPARAQEVKREAALCPVGRGLTGIREG